MDAFIAEHSHLYPVSTMCRVFGVSVSGYYEWRGREPSRHAREDGELAKEIHRIFYAHRQAYSSPRIHVELRELGRSCSKERVARLMREMELCAKARRNKPVGTRRRKGVFPAPNLLGRDFAADAPKRKWGSSTTSSRGRLRVAGYRGYSHWR
jgi:putative transposase